MVALSVMSEKRAVMKTIKVCVTKEDIAKGKRDTATKCPVALALNRIGFKNAKIGNYACTLKGNWNDHVAIPTAVRNRILKFDVGASIKPFTFILKIP